MKLTDDVQTNLTKIADKQHTLSSLTKASESVRHVAEATSAWRRELDRSAGLRKFVKEANRHHELLRAALGPSDEIRRMLSAIARPHGFEALEQLTTSARLYETSFRLPAFEEAAGLAQAHQDRLSEIARAHADSFARIQRTIESMRSPWLNATRELQSLSGLAALQGIGQAIQAMPAFSEQLSSVLRADLGDWRDRVVFPKPIFDDIARRTEFYVERGFDTNLTDFPAEAFDQALDAAALRTSPPSPIVLAYGAPIPAADGEQEEGFARTNIAHDWLLRMESHLRQFIDELMTAAHGSEWPRHRLPNGLYEQWRDKKQKAEQGGRSPQPLIAYADFTDYELIICKRDNWPLFAPTFQRPEAVRESFQRLFPIRLCTMHARLITQDDQVYLYAEVKRLMKAVRSRNRD